MIANNAFYCLFNDFRVQSQETQGIVKRGRKYQMLPAEEKKFCAFLEWSASINKSRTESLFLNEIKDHFDHLEIRSDFEENKPGRNSTLLYCEAKCKMII